VSNGLQLMLGALVGGIVVLLLVGGFSSGGLGYGMMGSVGE
jgi:hypothetical protein